MLFSQPFSVFNLNWVQDGGRCDVIYVASVAMESN